jgi:hypothetical protein
MSTQRLFSGDAEQSKDKKKFGRVIKVYDFYTWG